MLSSGIRHLRCCPHDPFRHVVFVVNRYLRGDGRQIVSQQEVAIFFAYAFPFYFSFLCPPLKEEKQNIAVEAVKHEQKCREKVDAYDQVR